jgi:hypothetical protein
MPKLVIAICTVNTLFAVIIEQIQALLQLSERTENEAVIHGTAGYGKRDQHGEYGYDNRQKICRV